MVGRGRHPSPKPHPQVGRLGLRGPPLATPKYGNAYHVLYRTLAGMVYHSDVVNVIVVVVVAVAAAAAAAAVVVVVVVVVAHTD